MKAESDLDRRVWRLEWCNLVLFAAMLVMVAYCILLGVRQPVTSPVAEYPRNIVAERVAVVDGSGRERIVLTCPEEMEGGCRVTLTAANGREAIALVNTTWGHSFLRTINKGNPILLPATSSQDQ